MVNSYRLRHNIYTEKTTSQDLSIKNLLISKLASESCMQAKTSCLAIGSHANREELHCSFPILTWWSEEKPEPTSQHHSVKITHNTKKRGKSSTMVTAKCHEPAINKNLHHCMTTEQCFCVWRSMVEPSARSVWPESWAAGVSEKFVAHFWMSHLYCKCFHLHSSVMLCISHTTAFAVS